MKAGFCIGINKRGNIVYDSKNYLMMEEFMHQENIEESKNVLVYQDPNFVKYVGDFIDLQPKNSIDNLMEFMFQNQNKIIDDYENGVNIKPQQEMFVVNKKSVENNNVARKEVMNKVEREILTERDKFILAGKARFTLQNVVTKNRYTFQVKISSSSKKFSTKYYFVSVLTGNDNSKDYTYIGMLRWDSVANNMIFYLTKNSKMKKDSVPVRGFNYLIKNINNLPNEMKFYHAGFCARCGRELTVPESIKSGFGPECIKLISKNN